MSKHPDQPKTWDDEGTERWQSNPIVRYLVNMYPGGIGALEEHLRGLADKDDWAQLAQLIGYSVDGWYDLSYTPDYPEDEP